MKSYNARHILQAPIATAREEGLAEVAFEGLISSLAEMPGRLRASREWVAWLTKHCRAMKSHLTSHASFRKVIIGYDVKTESLRSHPKWQEAPFALYGMALLAHRLYVEAPNFAGTDLPDLERWALAIVDHFLGGFLEAQKNQVTSLLASVRKMGELVSSLAGVRPVILLEFPIGNSIPTKLLARILEQEKTTFSVVRCGIPRKNKSGSHTKKDLLVEQLQTGTSLPENCLVVYLDEWNSGANFREICGLLSTQLRSSGVQFVPAALLSPTSSSHDRYASHVREHDRIVAKSSLRQVVGEDLRFTMAPLATGLVSPAGTQFFWGEYDRLSGYRKMQVWGAVFSSLDCAVALLKSDGDYRRRLICFLLLSSGYSESTAPTLVEMLQYIECQLLCEGFTDYEKAKSALMSIALPSNRGGNVDIDVEIGTMAKAVTEKVQGQKCHVPSDSSVYAPADAPEH